MLRRRIEAVPLKFERAGAAGTFAFERAHRSRKAPAGHRRFSAKPPVEVRATAPQTLATLVASAH
jgi:hypothetical protein